MCLKSNVLTTFKVKLITFYFKVNFNVYLHFIKQYLFVNPNGNENIFNI